MKILRLLLLANIAVTPLLGYAVTTVTNNPANTLTFGQLASTTNPLTSERAREYITGIQLAFDRANREPNAIRQMKLVTLDDNFDASKAPELTRKMVEEHNIVGLIGSFGTQQVIKLSDSGTLEKFQLANFAPMTGLSSALALPQVFPMRATYDDEVLAMFQHAAQLNRKRIGVLSFRAGVGTHLNEIADGLAKKAGVELVANQLFNITRPGLEQQATVTQTLRDTVPETLDALVVIAVGPVHSDAVQAIRSRYGASFPIYSLGQVDAESLMRDIGPRAATGVMFSQVMPWPTAPDLKVVREFQEDLRKADAKKTPSHMMLEGYVSGRIVAEIARKAKSTSRDGILAAASQIGELDLGGFKVNYDSRIRRSVTKVEMTMLSRSGKLIR